MQYACEDYIKLLGDRGMIPSMSRPGHPCENASCESFLKTLKREEIYANVYLDLEHLAAGIEAFIEHYHNRCRLHPGDEFEVSLNLAAAMKVTGTNQL